MWFDGDLSFDNEYRHFYETASVQGQRDRPGGSPYGERFHDTFLGGTTKTGLRINFAPVGSAILWAPFYIVADTGVRIARASGSDIPADGYSTPYIAAVVYASAFYGFVALLLSIAAATTVVTDGTRRQNAVTIAALAAWLGTPLLFYMYLAPGFSHAVSAFAVAAFVVLWLRVRQTWSLDGVVALGAMAAVMGMVREQDLFIAIGPALDYVTSRRAIGDTPTFLARGAAGIAACAICFLPQLVAYYVIHGRPTPSPQVEQKMTWTSPHAWQVIASPENGLFFWTPVALAALGGLIWLARRSWLAFVCTAMVATQIYVGGSLDTWAGAGSFGQRRLVGLTVFFVIGLTALLHDVVRSGWPRYAVQLFLIVAVWWNLALMAQFGTGLMDRQRLHIARNAYHSFVTIPRQLPRLAYRFMFDRESFYGRRVASTP
jgi:hypothetical protein